MQFFYHPTAATIIINFSSCVSSGTYKNWNEYRKSKNCTTASGFASEEEHLQMINSVCEGLW